MNFYDLKPAGYLTYDLIYYKISLQGEVKKKNKKIFSQEKNEAKENRQASCWDKHYEKVWIQARMIVKYNIWKKILHSDGIDSNFRQKINANSMS